MIEYVEDGHRYSFSYLEAKEHYHRICNYSDIEFQANVIEILHFACFICYFKEVGICVLSDRGLIHELVHLLHIKDEPLNQSINELRTQFQTICKLA